MAAKTFYLANVAVSGFGTLTETDPGAATTGTGWVVAKTASGNFSKLLYATERAANTFSTTNGLTTPATPASGDSWRSTNTINGTFANANWVLTFAVRAVTSAGGQLGRINCRIWKSANANGSAGTQLTSSILTGGILAGISTSADNTTAVTWSPGAAVTLTNEYLFVQCQWEITTAGGGTTNDIDFRTTATVVTSNFVQRVDGSATGATVAVSASKINGTPTGSANYAGALQTGNASLIVGSASASVDASGTTITDAGSIIEGARTGNASAGPAIIAQTASLIGGAETGAANVAGSTFSVVPSIFDGATAASASIDGISLSTSGSIASGSAIGNAFDNGSTLSVASSLIEGDASAISPDGQADGVIVGVSIQKVSGTASGTAPISLGGGYFAAKYFANSYFAPRFFTSTLAAKIGGNYFAARYFCNSYFARRYFCSSKTEAAIDLGVAAPPQRFRLVRRDAEVRGQRINVQCYLSTGIATATAETFGDFVFIENGSAIGVATDDIKVQFIGGNAHGEINFTEEEEFMLILAEAA